MSSQRPSRNVSPKFLADIRSTPNVYFYKSGDRYFDGVRIPVNPKRYRTLDALLDDLSGRIPGLHYGARGIYTARGRHRVQSLDRLQHMGSYVCSDRTKKRVPGLHPSHSSGGSSLDWARRKEERLAALGDRQITNIALQMFGKPKTKGKKGAKRSKSLTSQKSNDDDEAVGAAVIASSQPGSATSNRSGKESLKEDGASKPGSAKSGGSRRPHSTSSRRSLSIHSEPPNDASSHAEHHAVGTPARRHSAGNDHGSDDGNGESAPDTGRESRKSNNNDDTDHGDDENNEHNDGSEDDDDEDSGDDGTEEDDGSDDDGEYDSDSDDRLSNEKEDGTQFYEIVDPRGSSFDGYPTRTELSDVIEEDETELTPRDELGPLDGRKLTHVQRRRITSKETHREVEAELNSEEQRRDSVKTNQSRRSSKNSQRGDAIRKSSVKSQKSLQGRSKPPSASGFHNGPVADEEANDTRLSSGTHKPHSDRSSPVDSADGGDDSDEVASRSGEGSEPADSRPSTGNKQENVASTKILTRTGDEINGGIKNIRG